MRFSHLGSVSLVLDDQGTILEQQRYLPFGLPRTTAPFANVTSTDFTYTGQRNLPGTGLMDYNARFYSPTLGRFTQPDTIIPIVANPRTWNRYSYAYNNPILYNDPDGHCGALILVCAVIVIGAVMYGISVFERARQNGPLDVTPVVMATSTPTPTGQPPYKNPPTQTMNPTLSSLLTATPTGTLPTAGPMLLSGPTLTPTIAPTSTLGSVDPRKVIEVVGSDANNIKEICTTPGLSCSNFFINMPKAKNFIEFLEYTFESIDFFESLEIKLPKNRNIRPPISTGTPVVVPTPAPSPPVYRTPRPYRFETQ